MSGSANYLSLILFEHYRQLYQVISLAYSIIVDGGSNSLRGRVHDAVNSD
jgi:hypothetical protein